jgi:hypothetical protein
MQIRDTEKSVRELDDYELGDLAYPKGVSAFIDFASGDCPFQGKATPKNPYRKDTCEHIMWGYGYDDASVFWFSNGIDPYAGECGSIFRMDLLTGLPENYQCWIAGHFKGSVLESQQRPVLEPRREDHLTRFGATHITASAFYAMAFGAYAPADG